MIELLEYLEGMLQGLGIGLNVHWGDPTVNPQWDIPYLAIAPSNDSEEPWTMGPGGRNKAVLSVSAYLVVSALDGFRNNDTGSPVDRELIRNAEAVKAALRADVTLDGRVLTYRSIGVQYRSGIRGGEGIRVAQITTSYEAGRAR